MRNILLHIQFDGTLFSGWQEQDGPRTVQQDVREALETLLQHPVALSGSSRTDKGVHAKALAANFKTPKTIPVDGLRRGLNGLLAKDLAILCAQEVPGDFDARHHAVAKTYEYGLQLGETRLPHHHWNTWHVPQELDLEAMEDAGSRLLGVHRFGAFRASGCTSRTSERRMYAVKFKRSDREPLLVIEITGNAFLRNMVRVLAGTLVEVGLGRRSPESVDRALKSQDRRHAGVTATARGLTLHTVHFEGYPRLGKPPRPVAAQISAESMAESSSARAPKP